MTVTTKPAVISPLVVDDRHGVADRLPDVPALVEDARRFVAQQAEVQPARRATLMFVNDATVPYPKIVGGAAIVEPEHAWVSMGARWAAQLQEGVSLLARRPFDTWSGEQQRRFLQAMDTLLHEVGHVTLPAYDVSALRALPSRRPPSVNGKRALEEGLTQVVGTESVPSFLQQRFGVTASAEQLAALRADSVGYWSHVTAIKGLLELGGRTGPDAVVASRLLADATPPDQRFAKIAQWIAATHAPEPLQPRVARRIEQLLPGIVSGGRWASLNSTKLSRLLSAVEAGAPLPPR